MPVSGLVDSGSEPPPPPAHVNVECAPPDTEYTYGDGNWTEVATRRRHLNRLPARRKPHLPFYSNNSALTARADKSLLVLHGKPFIYTTSAFSPSLCLCESMSFFLSRAAPNVRLKLPRLLD